MKTTNSARRSAIKLADPNNIWRNYDHEKAGEALDNLSGLWAEGNYPSGDDIRRWRRDGSR
jgi:hypothetical protein